MEIRRTMMGSATIETVVVGCKRHGRRVASHFRLFTRQWIGLETEAPCVSLFTGSLAHFLFFVFSPNGPRVTGWNVRPVLAVGQGLHPASRGD